MKHPFKKLICTTSLVLIVLSSFKNWTDKVFLWKNYNIALTVPSDFTVVNETKNEFEMEGDGMELFMYTFHEKKISIEEMDEATKNAAKKMKIVVVNPEHPFKNGDVEGYYVEGQEGDDRVILAGMIDLQSRTNFFIVFTFDDTDALAQKEALKILKSVNHK